jgi:hypothetical protein
MSFSWQQAQSFLAPLVGKTSTFLLEDRRANLNFARTVMTLLARNATASAIVDLDAFYSSNSDRIFSPTDIPTPKETIIRVPGPGAEVEGEFSTLFETEQKVVIIDSLNSFYHLISLEDGSSRNRKLTFAIASLSFFAKTNGKTIILTMYRREGFTRGGTGRSISALSDLTASVETKGEELTVRIVRGLGWPAGTFSIRIPSGGPYRSQ